MQFGKKRNTFKAAAKEGEAAKYISTIKKKPNTLLGDDRTDAWRGLRNHQDCRLKTYV